MLAIEALRSANTQTAKQLEPLPHLAVFKTVTYYWWELQLHNDFGAEDDCYELSNKFLVRSPKDFN